MALTPDGLALMKRQCLHELSKRVVTIPSGWSTVVVYDALVEDGVARHVVNISPLMRGYIITPEGRKLEAESLEKPFLAIKQ